VKQADFGAEAIRVNAQSSSTRRGTKRRGPGSAAAISSSAAGTMQ
jgi:hypothetical protein